jgi:hypothetical protein
MVRMGVEPDPVVRLIRGKGRGHAAHAAALAHEMDRNVTAGAQVLGCGADVPVELSCKFWVAHVLVPTLLRQSSGAQCAGRLGCAAPERSAGSVAPLP